MFNIKLNGMLRHAFGPFREGGGGVITTPDNLTKKTATA